MHHHHCSALIKMAIFQFVIECRCKDWRWYQPNVFTICNQINWLPYQRPLSDLKMNIRLIIITHMSTKAENLVKNVWACSEIIGLICRFLPFFFTQIQQVALLWQRDRTTHLSVEIMQLQNIPSVWHCLRDPTFSRFYTIPECDTHTHRNGRTDTRRRHVLR